MNVLRSILVASLVVAATVNVYATEKDSWGLVSGTYHVGASKLVTKDYGSLEIYVSASCSEEVDQVKTQVLNVVDLIQKKIQLESSFSLVNVRPEVSVTSQPQYVLQYRNGNYLTPFYVDACNGNKEVSVGV